MFRVPPAPSTTRRVQSGAAGLAAALGFAVMLSACPKGNPSNADKHRNRGTSLAPRFVAGQTLTYKGRLAFKVNMTLMGSAHRQQADLHAAFTLRRKVTAVKQGSVHFVERLVDPKTRSPGTDAQRLKALNDEFARMELHWAMGPGGRILSFRGRNMGPVLARLKLDNVFRHLYGLATRTPGKPVLRGATWAHKDQTKTPFQGMPVTVILSTKYEYKGLTRIKGQPFHVIHGRERGVIPDTQESRSRHKFKLGGLIRGRIEVLLDPTRNAWKVWRLGRVMGFAATKHNPQGKELTYGLRYEMRLELELLGKAGKKDP